MNSNLESLRSVVVNAKPKKELIGDLKRDLTRGWLLPCLLDIDAHTWGRWMHWAEIQQAGCIGDKPIPRITFEPHQQHGKKMIERCLNSITRYGSWQGWSSFEYFNYFLDWILYGFGYNKELPKEPGSCEGASMRLYQLFCLETLIAFPNDDLGDMLAENAHGRRNGFFPTPLDICEMMTLMQMGDGDMRTKTVMDPCLGTGRMLLCASNYSYRLYGQDIDKTVIKAALVNGYLYAPWLVKSFLFLDTYQSAEPDAAIIPNITFTKHEQLELV